MKKLYLKRVLKLAALLIPLIAIVHLAQHYLFFFQGHDPDRINDYRHEEPGSLDVLFLGASDLYAGIAPGMAYGQHGFTSYIYSVSDNTGLLYRNMLKEALKTQNPGLILIEIEGFTKTDDMFLDEYRLSLFEFGIPMSLNKIETIMHFPGIDKLSHLIPLITYHGDWTTPDTIRSNYQYRTTDSDEPTFLKGMLTRTIRDEAPQIRDISGDASTLDLTPLVENELNAFLDLLEKLQLKDRVVFFRMPHKITEEYEYEQFQRANRVEQIIRERGYPFENFEFMLEELDISYGDDFFDSQHLNIYGQRKLMEKLGDLIVSKYGLTPRPQSDENAAHWDLCARYYDAYYLYGDKCFQDGVEEWMYDYGWIMSMITNVVENGL